MVKESIKKSGVILLLNGEELIQYTGEGSSSGVVSVSLLTLLVFAVVLVRLRK